MVILGQIHFFLDILSETKVIFTMSIDTVRKTVDHKTKSFGWLYLVLSKKIFMG